MFLVGGGLALFIGIVASKRNKPPQPDSVVVRPRREPPEPERKLVHARAVRDQGRQTIDPDEDVVLPALRLRPVLDTGVQRIAFETFSARE
jgi:hypothetical protein